MFDITEALEGSLESGEKYNNIFRPSAIDEFIGNSALVERLKIAINAAKQRQEPVDHILLTGGPGLGKTTVANLIAKECGSDYKSMNAAALTKPQDFIDALVQIEDRTVIFLDEVHAVSAKLAENLYTAMEDFKITIPMGNKQMLELNTKRFCLVGATTHPGRMPEPLRDRFGINYHMEYYSEEEIQKIVHGNFSKLEINLHDGDSVAYIANCSRGIPRIANKLVRRVRDYVQVTNNNEVSIDKVIEALNKEGIDSNGFTNLDKQYLKSLWTEYRGGPCGPKSIATSMGQDTTTITESIEPFLIRKKFISLTPRGRVITSKGSKFLFETKQ